ncbi:sugar ABC transporter ATP-binding protein [Aureimonas jatrophae]|uniref:Monosaccharide ABC transporter ATP-binding protein, CUT2 family n=1 Tax=Aureimonas jatrophae TaxID=1166073 RepID=A0A1H0FJV2_9HYPH|nr:sugar ABC transporter ATP-binding protein [Aureimonas jatrophae]MBB3949982.1 ABC-type sugar transport system ATPase subunit [Aureimonas jatrophae]SDN94943.1 monosaccharide ABC transporter ATP-binding protein, CUT2 family [Aureimonas jatrophae]
MPSERVPSVALRGIEKSFGPVSVLKGVEFDLYPGEVHALMGENGAGKSTMIRIMSGAHQPNRGTVEIDGTATRLASPADAKTAGIAVVHQELLLFPAMTVAENIFLGHAPRRAGDLLDWSEMRRRARALLDRLDCPDLDVDETVSRLSVANRQRVEIARALSRDARVLIMDEPTAALAEADVRRLLDVVRSLRAQGVGIVYVSHRMNEIFEISDRVTVLRDGRTIDTRPTAEVSEASLVSMMVGRDIDQLFPKEVVPVGDTVLEVRGLTHGAKVRDVSFSVRASEILGIAGLVGSGRTELAQTIFGVTPPTAGEIRIDGKPVTVGSVREAIDHRIAYVPEDRAQHGLVRPQSIRENVSMAILGRLTRRSVVDTARERELAEDAIRRFAIRARGPGQIVAQLSGGNQQKVVIAKWLATDPRILILDEPTRGVDVGAKTEIHKLMNQLAAQGLAIVMISSELPEVLGMSDRVLVMNGGRVSTVLDRAEATPETVGAAMMTGHAA